MIQYSLTVDKLFRNHKKQSCPYDNTGEAINCGTWCPLFELTEDMVHHDQVILHCGNGRKIEVEINQ
jgi:hypothetical protein